MRLVLVHVLHAVLAAVCLVPQLCAQARLAADIYRQRGSARESVTIDPARLAVQCDGPCTAAALVAGMQARGLPVSSAEPAGVPQWFAVDLTSEMRDATVLRTYLDAALHVPRVAFTAPVLRGRDGAFVTITRDLLLRTRPGAHAQTAAVLAAVLPDAEVLDAQLGTMAGALRARSAARDGLTVLEESNRLALDARIEWAEPDWLFTGHSCLIPNDPGFPQLWGMQNTGQFGGTVDMDMDADLAWDITTGAAAIQVAVLDVGVQQAHPDLNIAPGEDFTGQNGGGDPVNSCDNHGTAVAGCVSAILGNALGTVGIAPGCPVLSVRTFVSTSPCNGGWTSVASWTVNALAWAQLQGARVTNNSNAYGFTSAAIDAQYQASWNAGVVHFASAGNGSATQLSYPASIPVVNSVAALSPTGALAPFSNRGPGLDFAAPGDLVYSTDRTGADGFGAGDYGLVSGTSFAAPYAAGVAALVLSRTPALTAAQVELAMRATRDLGTSGYDTSFGWGFVNANSALRSIPYGAGLGGAFGIVPQLYATGLLGIGSTVTLHLERATGGSLGVVALGASPAALPVFNGLALVAPPWVTLGVLCSGTAGLPAAGAWSSAAAIPNSPALVNSSVYLQGMLIDVGSPPNYLSFTNGLQLNIGP